MASTYSNLGIELIGAGEQTGTWGTTTNTNLGTLIDQAISGYEIYSCTGGTDTITIPNGASGVARNMTLQLNGTGGGNLVVPTNEKLYFIFNNTASAITVKVTTGVSVPAGAKMILVCNGTDVLTAQNYLASLTLGTPLTVANGGSGVASATAYAVLCGGTTSTGPIQAIASVGTTGQVLTSNGAAALPTMQTITSFVTGMIIMWYGTVATIPAGWYLCNGSNSTPDLRNKFVIAADADSGGAAKTTVTGTATQSGGTANAVVVSHTHTATVSDPGHNHTANVFASGGIYAAFSNIAGPQTVTTSTATTGITVSNSTEGVSGTNQNLPPYYALCYIMKS